MQKQFLLEYNTRYKLRIRSWSADNSLSGGIVVSGWLYYESRERMLRLIDSNPKYKDHGLILNLIPKEIIMLCDIIQTADPAADWLNYNYPELGIHAQ